MIQNTSKIIDEFTLGYIYSALWWLEEDYDISDVYPYYLAEIIDECDKFQEENKQLLNEIYARNQEVNNRVLPEHLGHDFWLCRNNFEPEFMKRLSKELAQKFEQAAKKMGKQRLIVDDDILKFIFEDSTVTI